MAKFLSQVYTSIRGKVGGIVYTKNQFAGLVARSFTSPTNPGTDGQSVIRSSFDDANARWVGLSQGDRDLWESYAATLSYQGPHGSYKLPGRQVFMSNLSLAIFGEHGAYGSLVAGDDPPLTAGFLSVGPIASALFVTASETGIAFSIGNNSGEDCVAIVQRSIAFEKTRRVYRGPWLFDENQGVDCPNLQSTLGTFTGLVADKRYFMRIRCISEVAPHRISSEYYLSSLAVTNGA